MTFFDRTSKEEIARQIHRSEEEQISQALWFCLGACSTKGITRQKEDGPFAIGLGNKNLLAMIAGTTTNQKIAAVLVELPKICGTSMEAIALQFGEEVRDYVIELNAIFEATGNHSVHRAYSREERMYLAVARGLYLAPDWHYDIQGDVNKQMDFDCAVDNVGVPRSCFRLVTVVTG